MHAVKFIAPVAIASSWLFAMSASAAPPPCARWVAPLGSCELAGKLEGCTLTAEEEETANNQIYSSTAEQACEKWAAFRHPGVSVEAQLPTSGVDGLMNCVLQGQTTAATTVTWDENITPDGHCFCEVTKPLYAGVNWSPRVLTQSQLEKLVNRYDFPYSLKKVILDANWTKNGSKYKNGNKVYKTDAGHDYFTDLQKFDIHAQDAAEIDHIIPRTDSKGCLCGSPTPTNAAVISKKLNGKMLNYSPKRDWRRALMYQQFGVVCDNPADGRYAGVLPPPPGASTKTPEWLSSIHDDIDETVSDVETEDERYATREAPPVVEQETGGCSAAGGSLLGVALALVGLRRRRRG